MIKLSFSTNIRHPTNVRGFELLFPRTFELYTEHLIMSQKHFSHLSQSYSFIMPIYSTLRPAILIFHSCTSANPRRSERGSRDRKCDIWCGSILHKVTLKPQINFSQC
jgi:hypothetical protein